MWVNQERVVGVGVEINETWSNDLAGGIDSFCTAVINRPDRNDLIVFDRYIGFESWRSGAVYYRAVFDYQVVHMFRYSAIVT